MPDWAKIILDLRCVLGSAANLERMMKRNGNNSAYLTKITRGEVNEPRWSIGDSLIQLYEKHVQLPIPMVGAMQQKKLI